MIISIYLQGFEIKFNSLLILFVGLGGNPQVVKIRETLNFSQAVFAKYLNVSVKTVQAWEQGIGKPTGASLKLLTIIKRKPSLLIELSA